MVSSWLRELFSLDHFLCGVDFLFLVNCTINYVLFVYQFILTPGPADELPVKVPPLVAAIRSNRYVHVKELYIWDVPMKHEDTATLVTCDNLCRLM